MNDRAKNGEKEGENAKGSRKKNTRLVQEKGSKNDAHKMRSGSGILQLCALLCGVKMHGKLNDEPRPRTTNGVHKKQSRQKESRERQKKV